MLSGPLLSPMSLTKGTEMSDVEYDGSGVPAEWEGERELWRRGLETRQDELRSLETSAAEARYFLPAMVTGLLATPAYIRASLSDSPDDVSGTVAKKIAWQEVLRDSSCSFTFLLTEQAVRWALLDHGGMVEQAEHLVGVSRLESVRLGVIPLGTAVSQGPMNTFTVYDDELATVEVFTGRLVFRGSHDVATYRELFAMYEEHALFGDEAREQIQGWAVP